MDISQCIVIMFTIKYVIHTCKIALKRFKRTMLKMYVLSIPIRSRSSSESILPSYKKSDQGYKCNPLNSN